MKKYIAILLLILAGIGITACPIISKEKETTKVKKEARILPGGGTTTVYVLTKNKKDEMSKKELLGAGTVVEAAGYIVEAVYHEDDVEKQAEMMEKAVEDKSAAIICHETGNSEIDASIKKAEEAGIPVFFIKDSTGEEEAQKAGEKAGQQAVDYLAK